MYPFQKILIDVISALALIVVGLIALGQTMMG